MNQDILIIKVTESQYRDIQKRLNEPQRPKPELEKLLNQKSMWKTASRLP